MSRHFRADDAGPDDFIGQCGICGLEPGDCVCPECPVCRVQGDPQCATRCADAVRELVRAARATLHGAEFSHLLRAALAPFAALEAEHAG